MSTKRWQSGANFSIWLPRAARGRTLRMLVGTGGTLRAAVCRGAG